MIRPFTMEELSQIVDSLWVKVKALPSGHPLAEVFDDAMLMRVNEYGPTKVVVGTYEAITYEEALDLLEMPDGSPFGVKE